MPGFSLYTPDKYNDVTYLLPCDENDFSVIDCDINFSDHLPLLVNLSSPSLATTVGPINGTQNVPKQSFPLWDKADRIGYYKYTGDYLIPLLTELDTKNLYFTRINNPVAKQC